MESKAYRTNSVDALSVFDIRRVAVNGPDDDLSGNLRVSATEIDIVGGALLSPRLSPSSPHLLFSFFPFHTLVTMAPSASKQKRLAEKAAKQAAKEKGKGDDATTSTSTPTGSVNGGSSVNTPLTSLSAATSQEDLTSMAKLQIATDR